MKGESNKGGAEFLLFSVTRDIQISDDAFKELKAGYPDIALGYDKLEKRLATFSKKEGIPYIPSLYPMRELQATGKNVHLPCDGHWSRDAHHRAANLLAEYLVAMGYL